MQNSRLVMKGSLFQYQHRSIFFICCFILLFITGCKKENFATPETRIDQLRNQVSKWYDSIKNGSSTNSSLIIQEIKSNSLSKQSISEYAYLQIDSLNFNNAYINFDSSKLTGLSVPIKININTGEYIQLSTVNYGNKTKGYFIRSIPDANWYKILGVKSDFTKMSGKVFVYNMNGKLISNAILVHGIVSNNVSTNQGTTNGNQPGAIKSYNWDDDLLPGVAVYCYIRHRSWYDVLSLAIIDSGNDLGIPLGGNYLPFDPFYPNYGGGGGGVLPPAEVVPPKYNCDCNCPEEEESFEHYLTNFEPKWGQIGDISTIMLEIGKEIRSDPAFSIKPLDKKLEGMAKHFNKNRIFVRNSAGSFADNVNSQKVDRYIYSKEHGWIDMHHFFYAAQLACEWNRVISFASLTIGEILQGLIGRSTSSWGYEDMASNALGIDFYVRYKDRLNDKSLSVQNAVIDYLIDIEVTNPQEAPNFDFLPHILNDFVPKNKSTKGLIGNELYQAAFLEFCKRSQRSKLEIIEAHSVISYSSNK